MVRRRRDTHHASTRLHAELIRLAVPTIVATMAVPLLGLVDTFFLGRLPDVSQLAGVAAASTILNAVFWVFGFLRMGTVGLVAQASGRQDRRTAAQVLFQSLFLAVACGLVLIALQGPIAWVGFGAMGAGPELTAWGRAYFHIRIYEAPFALVLYGVNGYLRGLGDSLRPMYLTFAISAVNILGDALLVPGNFGLPSFGAAGAAAASLSAMAVGSLIGVALAWRTARAAWDWGWLRHWATLPWRGFLSLQTDLFFRTLLLVLTLSAVTALAARLQSAPLLAAHAILLQLWGLVSYAVDGFALAGETMVGTYLGRGDRARTWASGRAALQWGLGLGGLFAGAYLIGSDVLSRLFTHDPEVQAVVRRLMSLVALSQPITALAYSFDGILIGATDSRYLRNAMLISSIGFVVLAWAAWQVWGGSLQVVWGSLTAFMALRAVTLYVRYRSGAWMRWREGATSSTAP